MYGGRESRKNMLKRGDEVVLHIESLASGGDGVARLSACGAQAGVDDGGMVVFVPLSAEGDAGRVRIKKRKKKYAEGEWVEITNASPDRVISPCAHFPSCGGCRFLHLSYEAQLRHKTQQVAEVFEHIGGMKDATISAVHGMKEPFHYRNKMEFTFSTEDGKVVLGLHRRGDFRRIVKVSRCFLPPDVFNDILQCVEDFVNEIKITAYDKKTHEGVLRHLVLREGKNTGEVLVYLSAAEDDAAVFDEIGNCLKEKFPRVKTFVVGVNRSLADVVKSEKDRIVFGDGFIVEKSGGFIFPVAPLSFFQSNTEQMQMLMECVMKAGNFSGDETVYDLYTGIGTIAFYISSRVKKVIGVESNPVSVELFETLKKKNNLENVECVPGTAEGVLPGLISREPADAVVLDPPRSGLHPKVLDVLIKCRVRKIVYVSCNPSTQAHDVKIMLENGYGLKSLELVDMFPHTPHIETVALLTCST